MLRYRDSGVRRARIGRSNRPVVMAATDGGERGMDVADEFV
jgi:hypothetical protein